jgi:hypothetical protein
MSSEGITERTKELILEFLNDAPSAAAIAGQEHVEGPVFDDPEEGYGDQVRDYDIGVTVAQRILNKRNRLGGFTDLSQLANISHFGRDKFHDLLYSFAKRVLNVVGIRFNYNKDAHANDALNIRKNHAEAGQWPEWLDGITRNYTDSRAAYSIQETAGKTLCIQAYLRANGISMAYVRAIGGGRLGRVKETAVSFNSFGNAGYETFELENPTFHDHGVDVYNVRWRWQWRLSRTDPWRELGATLHRIYVTLRAPTSPWDQVSGSSSVPWTDALELACKWAKGAMDVDSAAALITERYNASGQVAYDTSSGSTFYGWHNFNLTEMLNQLNSGTGISDIVNCTDSANTVSTLANLLGCDLWQSRMASMFFMNPIIAIGYNTWDVPFWGGFGYHEVAWKGGCTQSDHLFDGCLKVDGDADPTTAPHTPLLPTNMLFGDCSAMNYRRRLCTPAEDGCARCQPQPSARQRRPII